MFAIESPVERLDRLMFMGTLQFAPDGNLAMWCFVCKSLVAMPTFVAEHEWFDKMCDLYVMHLEADEMNRLAKT